MSMYLTLSFVLTVGSIAACIFLYGMSYRFISSYFLFRVNGHLCGRNALVITLTLCMGIMCPSTTLVDR